MKGKAKSESSSGNKKLSEESKIPSTSVKIKPEKLKALLPSHIVEEQEYDPERESHKSMILDHANGHVDAIELDKKLQVKKYLFFVVCMICNMVGVVLMLLGRGATPLFNRYQPDPTLFWSATVLYAPNFLFLKFLLLPSKSEGSLRRYIRQARRWREYVKREQRKVFLGQDREEEQHGLGDIEKSGKAGRGRNNEEGEASNKALAINRLARQSSRHISALSADSAGSEGGSNRYRATTSAQEKNTIGARAPSILISGKKQSASNKRISFQV
eukprot:gene9975-11027_t